MPVNTITQQLNIRYPIIQAPMLGVATPEMVAAAANAQCLGSLPLGDLSAEKCAQVIHATRRLTDQHFAVNIFVYDVPEKTDLLRQQYARVKAFMQTLATHNDLMVQFPDIDDIQVTDYKDQVNAVISEGCKILSFTFGNLDKASIQKLKDNGTILIGTCTSVKEALILEQAGIDFICVQGIEAGGHRATFASDHIPQIGGLSLLSQVHDAVKAPLIYGGGIYNARTMRAAKHLGAQAFQVGSLLLGAKESALQNFEKERLKRINETDIVLTRSFTGRYARGIKNGFIDSVEETDYILPYPYQNKLTGELRKAAKAKGNPDFVSIWAGQSINNFSSRSTTEILSALTAGIEEDELK